MRCHFHQRIEHESTQRQPWMRHDQPAQTLGARAHNRIPQRQHIQIKHPVSPPLRPTPPEIALHPLHQTQQRRCIIMPERRQHRICESPPARPHRRCGMEVRHTLNVQPRC